ncbi:9656_t:CDS:2 [Funneliformis caledonium]|uniref:chitin synthase n=1 Tax=Funneliformis caledonium TaxID=1117310 RepID=A0A9N9GGH6_9GLOM|nr:9656_t:CDS:2 [Funneliformis caledonium]
MEAGYDSQKRAVMLDRRKTLSRPERYQPATPMLPGDGKKSFDPWVFFSKVITIWAPAALLSSIGGLHDKSSQQAWREKIALCFIAVAMGGSVAFLTVGFTAILCPPSQQNNPDLFKRYGEAPGHLGISGWQFDITQSVNPKGQGGKELVSFEVLAQNQNGQDITGLFQRNLADYPNCQDPEIQKFAAVSDQFCHKDTCILKNIDDTTFQEYKITNTTKKVGFDWEQISTLPDYLVIDGNVLNLEDYMKTHPNPTGDQVDKVIRDVLTTDHLEGGKDATRLFFGRPDMKASVNCLVSKYYAGNIDKETIGCFTSQLFLYVSLTVILSIVLTRFVMACIFDWFISHRLALKPKNPKSVVSSQSFVSAGGQPWTSGTGTVAKNISMDDVGNDLFTVLLVTCYSEDETGLRCTCESMAATDYPDDRKLLFLVCDGIIIGSGNDKSTPDICIDLMEVEPEFENPQPQSYVAVAAGAKQHNMAKVYAGFFRWKDRRIPMVTIVKCGGPEEQGKPKPGNRGKRDSQLILMNFFSRVTYNDRMCALDYDLFRKIHHLMGVTPDFFEIVLMVDADTKVYPNSLRLLINCMCNDPLIMGLCGETKIANKRDSWVTAIQVFEYYISHHLGKGFESVFGGVTCLPGCFCMYRLKARKGDDDWVPIVTKPEIVQEYSQNTVETLHQKNLLLLGEDRFLTTLMLRNFPHRKMMFCPQAVCKTVVPDDFWVLLSQRRRWINSTIHNLMELVLVRNLCGTFCFSMQFVVFMELIGTVVLPVAIVLTYALVVNIIIKPPQSFTEAIPLVMLGMVLGLPAILILITTRKLIYIAWMLVYLLALPVPLKRWEDWERTRIRRNKRQERERQQVGPTHDPNSALLSGNDGDYYGDSGSVHSQTSADLGPQQYYDYSVNSNNGTGYPPQQYYQQAQFEDVGFGNTHELERAPSPNPQPKGYY